MFGREFENTNYKNSFPNFDKKLAVLKEDIERMSPLIWQEHCVECSAPECYTTCPNYRKRIDGRCKLFDNGIVKRVNEGSINDENVIIHMGKWAKLETILFKSSFKYDTVDKINEMYSKMYEAAQKTNIIALKKFIYYIKEILSRIIGNINKKIPEYLLIELIGDNEFNLCLETKTNESSLFRKILPIKKGYNRFIISSKELNIDTSKIIYLFIYPESNEGCLLNIISLDLVDFKDKTKYISDKQSKVKLVIWDLDNTVWNGILGDDGIENINLKENIIDIIKDLDKKGIINSISSKNYYEKAVEALKKFDIFDYFVYPKINWEPKSINIKDIVKTINIGMDAVLFVDDSEYELNEVKYGCKEIKTCNVNQINELIKTEIFNVPITEESKNRRLSYQQNLVRKEDEKKYSSNIDQFIMDSNIEVYVNKPVEDEINRCFELVQRSNQLNISGERLSIDEIKEILNNPRFDCYRIRVKDKYGDYGLVGFAILDINDENTVQLQHFVFSCRAARKKIELNFFIYLCLKYAGRNYKKFEILCKKTRKNQLMISTLEESNIFQTEKRNDYSIYYISLLNFNSSINLVNISNK